MKTPQEWIDEFTGQDRSYGPNAALANIKAIQDEAFKAGMDAARALIDPDEDPEIAIVAIDNLRKKLP